MNALTISTSQLPAESIDTDPLTDVIERVENRIPPLWPLDRFVAVNPFLGFSGSPFAQAAAEMKLGADADLFMPEEFYLEQYRSGAVTDADLQMVLARHATFLAEQLDEAAGGWTADQLVAMLKQPDSGNKDERFWTVAELMDESGAGRNWTRFFQDEISKWTAAHLDQGQAGWQSPYRDAGLYQAWRSAAVVDERAEWQGMHNFRQVVAALPETPEAVIGRAASVFGLTLPAFENYLFRLAMSISGWAGYLQFLRREGESESGLTELLAIRVSYDLGLFDQIAADLVLKEAWLKQAAIEQSGLDRIQHQHWYARLIWQEAYEAGYQRQMIDRFAAGSVKGDQAADLPAVQAVFCIDVRSEPYRRALESVSSQVETIGFAGFFGMAIELIDPCESHGSARCPVLLQPGYRVVNGQATGNHRQQTELGWKKSWKSFQSSAVGCFSFVETIGLTFSWGLLREAFTGFKQQEKAAKRQTPDIGLIDLPTRIELGARALTGMGLTKDFARIVLLCGHGSETANNPYASGLDCGACGGHAGDVNARVAAAILNDREVREGLRAKGIEVPESTWFIPGLHNTTTDEVTLFDGGIPAAHDAAVETLRVQLREAGEVARQKRASSLGISEHRDLHQAIRDRSLNWSEVRPEWGLAGNAMFIAAPRTRTRHLDLGGRAFLHHYEAAQDTNDAVLELILTAPMVVANWINLQYYASTVDNKRLGSGTKTTQNVLGTFGMVQGNGGDLQVGLPIESVHDGQRWVHEPLRLNVVIEAEPERINAILERHAGVKELLDHGWLHLFVMDADGRIAKKYEGDLNWVAC